jgi:hypothetical protein
MFDPEPEDLWTPAMLDVLGGKVWHSTSVASFEAILADGFIRAKPPVNRHNNSFCQFLERVSLFDFRPAPNLMEAVARNDWTGFTRFRDEVAVWLRIDPDRTHVPTAASLRQEWRDARETGLITGSNHIRFISDLETGHPGDVPTSAVPDILLIDTASPRESVVIPFGPQAVPVVHAYRDAMILRRAK